MSNPIKLLTFFWCFYLHSAFAQPVIPRFEIISVNEGLSQSSVYAITQDKFGFMWFGTADGLNRYDGNDIKVYKVQNERIDVEANNIRGQLAEDNEGNIWFSNEAGIYYYSVLSDKIITAKPFDKKFFNASAFNGVYIRNGQFWMLNNTYGIFSFDLKNHTLQQFNHAAFSKTKMRIYNKTSCDEKDNIWFSSCHNDGLYSFNTKSRKFAHHFKNQDLLSIRFGKQKHFTIGKKNIAFYDSLTQKSIPLFSDSDQPDDELTSFVFEDNFKRVWAGFAGNGIACYDLKNKTQFLYQHDNVKRNSLPANTISCYYVDASDNLWIGTDGGGVARIDLKPPLFNLFPLNEGDYPFLKDYFTKAFYEDRSGKIWVGTHNNGFNIIDPDTRKVKNYNYYGNNKLNAVGAIFEDRDSTIWIGHAMGFLHFNQKKNKFTSINITPEIPLSNQNIFVNDIRQLLNGNIIAATQYGLVLFQKVNGIYEGKTCYQINELGSQATAVAQTKDSIIWVATTYAGLLKIKHADSLIVTNRFWAGMNIRSIHIDETTSDILWLATAKGLIKFNTRTNSNSFYTEKNGMTNSFVYGVLEDEKHNLWMSTNGGLIYFDRIKNTFQNYNVNDGLQSNEFNSGAFHKGFSGTFYFGGINGFNWFRKIGGNTISNQYKPKVAITSISIDDQPFLKNETFLKTKRITLPFNQNKLSFTFAALDFTRPKANKIHYKLEGWDKEWVTTYSKSVNYPNLPPGDYTFKIQASNADGLWSDPEKIYINIKAPFWKQVWFYLALVILLVLTAILITHFLSRRKFTLRLQELEKMRAIEEERNRISKDMHDEIGSGLTHIALMTELIQTQQKADAELRKEVGNISASARKLVESMSEIIWALNPHNETLDNLLTYLREQTSQYFDPFDIDFELNFPEQVPDIKLSNEQRRNLFLVCKEALNNALKHASATKIVLTVVYKDGVVIFIIKDDGKGFDLSKIRKAANGLHNLQKRMSNIGGTFELKTSAESGTTVTFTLRLTKE